MTTTDTQVQELVINTLTKQEYESIQNPSDTEIYMVTDDLLANFIGADGTNAGVAGLVPPPQATDNTKFLKGNGSWSNIALSSSDITNALGYTPQNSSTAVTHTASTAVGSSTKPIYINISGVATASTSTVGGSSTPVYLNAGTITSTGLSIASSRFDGQWVAKTKDLSSATTQGTYTLDLNTYLPDANNQYEVIVVYTVNSKKTSVAYTTLYSDLIPITENILNIKTSSTSHVSYNGCLLNIPVRRYLYFKISNNSVDGAYIGAVAYRRIGTNS